MVDKVLDVVGTRRQPHGEGSGCSWEPRLPGSRQGCGNCQHRTPSLRLAGASVWAEEGELDVSEWGPGGFLGLVVTDEPCHLASKYPNP